MLKPQEYIDLSLKLKKRISNSEKDIKTLPVRKIDVAEISSTIGNEQLLSPSDAQTNINPSRPKHLTRVAKKMLAVQVRY